jgi:hypothetical protein
MRLLRGGYGEGNRWLPLIMFRKPKEMLLLFHRHREMRMGIGLSHAVFPAIGIGTCLKMSKKFGGKQMLMSAKTLSRTCLMRTLKLTGNA